MTDSTILPLWGMQRHRASHLALAPDGRNSENRWEMMPDAPDVLKVIETELANT
jgi:hypothetical protein